MVTIDYRAKKLYIRSITPDDKDQFMGLRKTVSEVSSAYEDEELGFLDYNWRETLKSEDTISMMVFRDNLFVGICALQDINTGRIELACDVEEPYRAQGIGTEIIRALIDIAGKEFPGTEVIARMKRDNIASRRAVEKNGGKYIGTDCTCVTEALQQELDKYGEDWIQEQMGEEKYQMILQVIEEGKEGVFVYRF